MNAVTMEELSLFDEVGDALRSMTPAPLGPVRIRARRYGIKVWFGPEAPTREHYEAQVISRDAAADARYLALEVGFHSEYPRAGDNDAVIDHLRGRERTWRKRLGEEAEIAPFLGKADVWRRISETWPDPDLTDPALVLEVATRLTDYVVSIEPVRRQRRTG